MHVKAHILTNVDTQALIDQDLFNPQKYIGYACKGASSSQDLQPFFIRNLFIRITRLKIVKF